MDILTPAEVRMVVALGEALAPMKVENQGQKMASYLDLLLSECLPFERAQIRALFQLVDKGYALYARTTSPLASAPTEEVEEYLKTWVESTVYSRRMAYEGLRSLLIMALFSNDEVNERAGISQIEDVEDPFPELHKLLKATSELIKPPVVKGFFLPRQKGLFEHSDYTADINLVCEIVVIGSGPAGALAAYELAKSGHDVVLVEAGGVARREDLLRDGGRTMARFFWDSGMRTVKGNVVLPTMQGRVLGGGSVVNSAICLRVRGESLEKWEEEYDVVGLSEEELAPHFDAVEAFMGVKDVALEVMGPRNDLFAKGAKAVGLKAEVVKRNESGCRGSGGCMLGCANGVKLSMDRRSVPEFLQAGGTVYTSVECDTLTSRNGRVTGMLGTVVHPTNHSRSFKVKISAATTILATGAIASPYLLQKSGLGNGLVGKSLLLHPATVVAGKFKEDVYPWVGATQGYHVTELLPYGIKLESLWADPALMSFRMPGLGRRLARQIKNYKKLATWDAWVSGSASNGSVRYVPGVPRPQISYNLGVADVSRLVDATATLAEMFFAAGATRVFPGVQGLPEMLSRESQIAEIRGAKVTPQQLPTGSNHVFGTLPMSEDPRKGPVDSKGKLHGVDDLYICDTSLFPSSPGVNPMLTAMAFGHRLAHLLHEGRS